MQNLKIWLVGFFGSLLLRLFRATLRLKIVDPSGALKEASNKAVIAAFWHGQQLMMPWLYLEGLPKAGRKPVYVLISKSQDGRFIAKVISFLGLGSIAGSSSRGGTEALLQLNRLVAEGSHIIFTPDGPRGPIHKVKSGVILTSSNTGVPVLPVAFAASSVWTFGSWDQMILPKPFSRATMYAGEKISIPANLSDQQVEEYQQELERALVQASTLAQQYC